MAKEIILYNLRDDVTEEDYVKWCESYKGPLLLGLSGSKSWCRTERHGPDLQIIQSVPNKLLGASIFLSARMCAGPEHSRRFF